MIFVIIYYFHMAVIWLQFPQEQISWMEKNKLLKMLTE